MYSLLVQVTRAWLVDLQHKKSIKNLKNMFLCAFSFEYKTILLIQIRISKYMFSSIVQIVNNSYRKYSLNKKRSINGSTYLKLNVIICYTQVGVSGEEVIFC